MLNSPIVLQYIWLFFKFFSNQSDWLFFPNQVEFRVALYRHRVQGFLHLNEQGHLCAKKDPCADMRACWSLSRGTKMQADSWVFIGLELIGLYPEMQVQNKELSHFCIRAPQHKTIQFSLACGKMLYLLNENRLMPNCYTALSSLQAWLDSFWPFSCQSNQSNVISFPLDFSTRFISIYPCI